MVVPGAARAGREVELEVRVALGGARHGLAAAGGQRRAAEVRVEDHAGRVDHPPQPGLGGVSIHARARVGEVGGLVGRREQLRAALGEHRSRRRDGDRARRVELRGELVDRRQRRAVRLHAREATRRRQRGWVPVASGSPQG